MRIKGAGQFGGQFGGQDMLRSVFSLYVTTCDSRRCVHSPAKRAAATLPCPMLHVYFTGATIALLCLTSIQLPCPTSPQEN